MIGDTSGILVRLRRLAAAPKPAKPMFGTEWHCFMLDPPLSAAEVVSAEKQFGVVFPEEYREFLVRIGAGGAGPAYGVHPLRCGPNGWGWVGDEAILTKVDVLHQPFVVDPKPPPGYEDFVASEPLKDQFVSVEEYEDAYQEWAYECERMLMEDPTRDVGAVCLSYAGCGYRTWLVVSGPAAGQMWDDSRCEGYEMEPLTSDGGEILTFGTWYMNWLDKVESVHLV